VSDSEYVTKAAVMMIIEQQGSKIKQLEQENAKLMERLKELEKINKFYASEENWNSKKYRDGALMLFEEIGGEKAREYFKKWGNNGN
jgi:hypothetical protein